MRTAQDQDASTLKVETLGGMACLVVTDTFHTVIASKNLHGHKRTFSRHKLVLGLQVCMLIISLLSLFKLMELSRTALEYFQVKGSLLLRFISFPYLSTSYLILSLALILSHL